jgi:hypothetical protein
MQLLAFITRMDRCHPSDWDSSWRTLLTGIVRGDIIWAAES